MRNCVQLYKKYNRIVEGAFGEVIRRRREAKAGAVGGVSGSGGLGAQKNV